MTKYEIAEVKQMHHPPRLVKLIMKAICVLLDVDPVMKLTKDGKQKLSFWRASLSSKVLGDPNFPDRLDKFDRSSLTQEKMHIIEEMMADPDYSLAAIRKQAVAAESLYSWVKALRDYHYIFMELEPRKEALINAEQQYEMATKRSNGKRSQI